ASCRVASYYLRRATPSLRWGGGTPPHTPRGSAYWRVGRVACVKAPGLSADRVGSRRVSLPTTYDSRLPRFARVGGRPPMPPEGRRTGALGGWRVSKHRG